MGAKQETIYIVAIRTTSPKGGAEVRAVLERLNAEGLFPSPPFDRPHEAHAIARPYAEVPAKAHDALRTLGFGFEEANRLVTVVTDRGEARGA